MQTEGRSFNFIDLEFGKNVNELKSWWGKFPYHPILLSLKVSVCVT